MLTGRGSEGRIHMFSGVQKTEKMGSESDSFKSQSSFAYTSDLESVKIDPERQPLDEQLDSYLKVIDPEKLDLSRLEILTQNEEFYYQGQISSHEKRKFEKRLELVRNLRRVEGNLENEGTLTNLFRNNTVSIQELQMHKFHAFMSKLMGIQKASFNRITHPREDDLKLEVRKIKMPPKAFQWDIFLKNLKELRIEQRFNPDEMERFYQSLAFYNKIEILHINLDRERYPNFFKSYQMCGSLKELRLRDWTKMSEDYKIFFQGLENLKNLRVFEFEIAELTEPNAVFSTIADVLRNNKSITDYTLNIHNMNDKYKELKIIGAALVDNQVMEHLTLNCSMITITKFYDELAKLSRPKTFTYNTQLRSNFNEGEQKMLKTCKILKKLTSKSSRLKAFDHQFRQLFDSISLNQNIEEIYLDAHLEDKEWRGLLPFLENQKLSKLAISGDKFLRHMSDKLWANTTLIELKLIRYEEPILKDLAEIFARNITMKVFHFGSVKSRMEDLLREVTGIVKKNKTLNELVITADNLPLDKGAMEIEIGNYFRALQGNETLKTHTFKCEGGKELEMSFQEIEEVYVHHVCETVSKNSSLVKLELEIFKFSAQTRQNLELNPLNQNQQANNFTTAFKVNLLAPSLDPKEHQRRASKSPYFKSKDGLLLENLTRRQSKIKSGMFEGITSPLRKGSDQATSPYEINNPQVSQLQRGASNKNTNLPFQRASVLTEQIKEQKQTFNERKVTSPKENKDEADEEEVKETLKRIKSKLEEAFFFNNTLSSFSDLVCKPSFITEKLTLHKDSETVLGIRKRYQNKFLDLGHCNPEELISFNKFIPKIWPITIDLSYCDLQPEHTRAVMQVIEGNSFLEELILDGNQLGPEFYQELGQELMEVQSLKKLSLENCKVDKEIAEILLDAITVNISLEKVILVQEKKQPKLTFQTSKTELKTSNKIQPVKLELSKSTPEFEIIEIPENPFRIQRDTELQLRDLFARIQAQVQFNKHFKKMKKTLQVCKTEAEEYELLEKKDFFVHHLSRFGAVLKYLVLVSEAQILEFQNKAINDQHCYILSMFLKCMKCPFEVINLRRNRITDKGLEWLCQGLRYNNTVTHLEVTRNKLTDIGLFSLVGVLKFNYILRKCIFEFGHNFSADYVQKVERETQANDIIYDQILLNHVYKKEKKEILDLNFSDKGVKYLHAAMKAVRIFRVKSLNLSDNLLEDFAVKKIVKTLKRSHLDLKILDLSSNQITGFGAQYLGELFNSEEHPNLKIEDTDLSNNRLTDSGIFTLCNALRQYEVQSHWVLNSNRCGKESLKIVLTTITFNPQIDIEFDSQKQLEGKRRADLLTSSRSKSFENIIVESDNSSSQSSSHFSIRSNQSQEEENGQQVRSEVEEEEEKRAPEETKDLGFTGTSLIKVTSNQRIQNLNAVQIAQNPEQKQQEQGDYNTNAQLKSTVLETSRKMLEDQKELAQISPPRNISRKDKDQSFSKSILKVKQQQQVPQQQTQETKEDLMSHPLSPLTAKSSPGGQQQEEQKEPNLIIKLIRFAKQAKKKATQFKCDESLKTSLNNKQQSNFKYLLFFNAIIFYSCALFNPLYVLWDGDSQKEIYRSYTIYIIYAFLAFCIELSMLFYMRYKINNKKLYEINAFIVMRMMSGQVARADLFTDAVFTMFLKDRKIYFKLFLASVIVLALSIFYPIFMYFRLLRATGNQNNFLPKVEQNAKIAYVSDFQALATSLDSFCLNNFHGIRGISITIPKLWALLKTIFEDVPQFIIQIIFLFTAETSASEVTIPLIFSILSLCASLFTAKTANTSGIDFKEVAEKLEERHQKMKTMTQRNKLVKQATQKYRKEDFRKKQVDEEEPFSPVKPSIKDTDNKGDDLGGTFRRTQVNKHRLVPNIMKKVKSRQSSNSKNGKNALQIQINQVDIISSSEQDEAEEDFTHKSRPRQNAFAEVRGRSSSRDKERAVKRESLFLPPIQTGRKPLVDFYQQNL